MMNWIIWIVSFVSLYIGVFWLHVVFFKEEPRKVLSEKFPNVSVVVPARNEEKGLWKTVHSIAMSDYPKEKIQIVIVNHGSIDKTEKVANKLIRCFSEHNIKLVNMKHEKGHMKSHAFNEGLKFATGKYVACVDADSIVMEDAIRGIIPFFDDKDVGAVISTIKVTKPTNIYEKLQHLEYMFATFTRTLMSKIDTLHISQGALSIYRKDLLDKFGGFDEGNFTEDLEIAMRLRYKGYKIKIAKECVSFTKVPDSFKMLWGQRVRWFRGFLYNTNKYKGMVMNKKYGLLGTFQYPLNILSVVTVLLMFSLLSYALIKKAIYFVDKFAIVGMDYFAWTWPSIKDIILSLNVTLLFPIAISFGVALFIYHQAHKNLKERWRYPEALVVYLTLYPFVRGMHWMTAFYKEVIRAKKKW
ncbi:glycosyltransferase family 2 protein [archaeon]|jgi:cellulose synthase/poly-beta-1,6-N-acetylglucosamine synthase-like glycosyltransferase|nr:glycosyltransferase family 2 protein [archaeon]MBT3731333.1 glycosyltransferase family 2 protein [archaeon]MBT5030200.1 glycosyltransferase family 2 protein [archaeon]MBT5287733.1 glycosyltransferase family 2 protein [archaeon]MBT7052379.1 glycosyltransferase family 2 protein [archaeon]